MPASTVKQILSLLPQMLIAGLISGVFIYFFMGREPVVFLLGIIIGLQVHFYISLFELLVKPRLSKRNFFLALLTSTVAYIFMIIIAVFIGLIIINKFDVMTVLANFKNILFSKYMVFGALFGLSMSFIFSTYSMFETLLGRHFLLKLFTGKYHTPFEEDRVFMFLDLKSSTTLAEKLGDKVFLQLLNDFFYDVSLGVLKTRGEIYKYVGDEVIITWKMNHVAKNCLPLDCFFIIKQQIAENNSRYLKKYGIIPEFKAGLHGGAVVTGEMGYVKKEITFLGDVLNTTSRIESLCNPLNKSLIVSDSLLSRMNLAGKYIIESLGENALRGKQQGVKVSSVLQ